jgi:mannose/fructose/N-acetylgalactosamine-specific phosphotransferase system component IIC
MLLGAGLVVALVAQNLLFEPGPIISRPVFLLGFLLVVLGVQIVGFGLVGEIIIYTQARNLKEYKVERVHGDAPGGRDGDG